MRLPSVRTLLWAQDKDYLLIDEHHGIRDPFSPVVLYLLYTLLLHATTIHASGETAVSPIFHHEWPILVYSCQITSVFT
jgi:hypothetical protein